MSRSSWKRKTSPTCPESGGERFKSKAIPLGRQAGRLLREIADCQRDDNRWLGACSIPWFDPATGVCEIEPLGVREGIVVSGSPSRYVLRWRMSLRTRRDIGVHGSPSNQLRSDAGMLVDGTHLGIKQEGNDRRRPTQR